jgi:RNA polymerase sigma-32 factor
VQRESHEEEERMSKTSRTRRRAETALVPVVTPSPGALERYDPFRRYMEEVRRYPLLTAEEERALAIRFRETQDPKAAHRLVTANLRLVVKIANEYRSHWTNLLDLVQEGNIGLLHAVKRYDPFRGVRLSSYAQYWIRAYIIYYLLANFRLVKIGTTQAQRKLFFRLQRAREQLLAMGINPGAKLLADRLDVTEEDVQQMSVRLDSPEVSLDSTPTGSDQPPLVDSLRSKNADPEADLGEQEVRNLISQALSSFAETLRDERERVLWHERLLADTPATLQDIGSRFGISRERARQIEERLKKRCRDFLTKRLGTEVKLSFLD